MGEAEDDKSFDEFVAEHGTSLLRLAYVLCDGSVHDAEDILQESLVKAYRNWSRIAGYDAPTAYVRRIVVNTVFNTKRPRGAVREIHVGSVPESAAPEESSTVDMRGALWHELRRLPHRQRAVVVLRYWADLSEQETARTLGCSSGTVKSQASRGLARLRTFLGEPVDGKVR